MAAVSHSVQPVTSGGCNRIYLEQIVTGKSAQKIVTDKGARNFFYRCLLKFGSHLQIFGSFAHKIALGGFFSSLSSG
jgi:hypothetical protein